MQTLREIFERLLPKRFANSEIIDESIPIWPPDVFGVVANIVNQSGVHLNSRINGPGSILFGPLYTDRVLRAGEEWRNASAPPRHVIELWSVLLKNLDKNLSPQNTRWGKAAIELLAIADEASQGIGLYDVNNSANESTFAKISFLLYISTYKKFKTTRFFNSLCLEIHPSEMCVQPKTLTSQVGCNIHSLSHNLSLLPSSSIAKSYWKYSSKLVNSAEPLNLLLIPFPYKLDGDTFTPEEEIQDGSRKSFYFAIKQNWLGGNNSKVRLYNYIKKLVSTAEKETGKVHGVILPELALNMPYAKYIAGKLAAQTDVEFFVSGVLESASKKNALDRNLAFTALFEGNKIHSFWTQSKHHRWKLDSDQIKTYRLGHILNPNKLWWERIDISERELTTMVFRTGSAMSVLVCEDLARLEPVQPVLRSIGPNLVIALLQDGAQISNRWSARYSASLTDDPGSSVLTFTSMGMLQRSKYTKDFIIGHWRDSHSGSTELKIDISAAAMLLNVVAKNEENFTLDGRTDNDMTFQYYLAGTHQIEIPKK